MKHNPTAVLQLTGAYIACFIGSGFATGQEVLQFFSSYGLKSYCVLAACLVLFLLVGHGLMRAGQENQKNPSFQCFLFFCKKPLGTFYLVLTPLFLFFILTVMIAGAGSTIHEYFGFSRPVGSAVIALMALASYLIGFEKLIKIVSAIAPLIIVFLLIVGVITIVKSVSAAGEAAAHFSVLSSAQPTPWWPLSAVSYAAMNYIVNAQYCAQLGVSAPTRKAAGLAAIIGSIAVTLTVSITNTAILLSAENAAQFDVPVLFLARQLAQFAGMLFCVFLILGIFSACATTMWTVCHQLAGKNKKHGRWIAVLVAAVAYAVSFVPFSRLIGLLYPVIGYLAVPFLLCVIVYELKSIIKKPS